MGGGAEDKLQWHNGTFQRCGHLYSKLIELMAGNFRFVHLFGSAIDSASADAFAQVVVSVLYSTQSTLALIRALIEEEFLSASSKKQQGAVLRGNTIVSKVEGCYVRIVGQEYLKRVLKQLLEMVVNNKELTLEVNPKKLEGHDDEMLHRQQVLLKQHAQMFLDRIVDAKMVQEMPREIRAIAGYTAESARVHTPDSVFPLIGGFLMLRYFSPAMVAPESWGLLSGDAVPSVQARRNLVLLAKLLQNASNGVAFTSKEDFMCSFNGFIAENKKKMETYLEQVATDPEATIEKDPWENMAHRPASIVVDLKQIDIQDLFELHRLLDQCSFKLIPNILKDKKRQKEENERLQEGTWITGKKSFKPADEIVDHDQIIKLIKDLGPAPRRTKNKKVDPKGEEILNLATPVYEDTNLGDITQQMDRIRFLYQGLQSKDGNAVFYMIVNKFRIEFLYDEAPLVQYIFKVMDSVVNAGSYSIVIDMSWAHLTNDLKKLIYKQIPKVIKLLSRKYKKNVTSIYIIHPNAYTRAVLLFMRSFTSRKFSRKIHEIYNWKDLTSFINIENILLPDTSKDYITKSYHVVKVNAKGKKQDRLIKFTLDSLLNIDPKTRRLQNEKKLKDIGEITSFLSVNEDGSSEIQMKFSPEGPEQKSRKKLMFATSKVDLEFRRYLCKNSMERDEIVADIFRACFNADQIQVPQEYHAIIVNQVGKRQERLFKLTVDSMLTLDGQKIKSELSFAGIEEVRLGEPNDEEGTLWLKYKASSRSRQIVCSRATLMAQALTQGVDRYKRDNDRDEDEERRDVDEMYTIIL